MQENLKTSFEHIFLDKLHALGRMDYYFFFSLENYFWKTGPSLTSRKYKKNLRAEKKRFVNYFQGQLSWIFQLRTLSN